MSKVMVRAWAIARAAVVKFGGKVREYLAAALRQAWSEQKAVNVIQVHEWTNARGMKIILRATHVTMDTYKDDWGIKYSKPCNEVVIHDLTVGNKVIRGCVLRDLYNGQSVLNAGEQIMDGKKIKMIIILPADIEAAVWGRYDEIENANKARRVEMAKKESAELQRKIAHGYDVKSGSYAWGDC